MAAIRSTMLPRLQLAASTATHSWVSLYPRAFAPQWLSTLSAAVPGISLNLPGLLEDIWEGILRAVPKNKVSHSRKRHRQMAGKALKDVNSLCKCPGCGQTKRTHRLCSHCLEEMKEIWKKDFPGEKPLGGPDM